MAVQFSLTDPEARFADPNRRFEFDTATVPITSVTKKEGRVRRAVEPLQGPPIITFYGSLPERLVISGTYRRVQAGINPLSTLKLWSRNGTRLILGWINSSFIDYPTTLRWQVEEVDVEGDEFREEAEQIVRWQVTLLGQEPRVVIPPMPLPPGEIPTPLTKLSAPTSVRIQPEVIADFWTGNLVVSWGFNDVDTERIYYRYAPDGTTAYQEAFTILTNNRRFTVQFFTPQGTLDVGRLINIELWAQAAAHINSDNTPAVSTYQPYRLQRFRYQASDRTLRWSTDFYPDIIDALLQEGDNRIEGRIWDRSGSPGSWTPFTPNTSVSPGEAVEPINNLLGAKPD